MIEQQDQEQQHHEGEDSTRNSVFIFSIMVIIFFFYTGLYVEEHSSSIPNNNDESLSAHSLLSQCNNFTSFQEDSHDNICDPDTLIGYNNKESIQQTIDQIESYYSFRNENAKLNIAVVMKAKVHTGICSHTTNTR